MKQERLTNSTDTQTYLDKTLSAGIPLEFLTHLSGYGELFTLPQTIHPAYIFAKAIEDLKKEIGL